MPKGTAIAKLILEINRTDEEIDQKNVNYS